MQKQPRQLDPSGERGFIAGLTPTPYMPGDKVVHKTWGICIVEKLARHKNYPHDIVGLQCRHIITGAKYTGRIRNWLPYLTGDV